MTERAETHGGEEKTLGETLPLLGFRSTAFKAVLPTNFQGKFLKADRFVAKNAEGCCDVIA